ncbi:FecR protein [Rosistilla carotiformis]|uniref:FecR protein n=1 Tax=Rosistilla carotiformis TaxID=2528017 RepID=A0A518JY63_9BACT|nr:FecR domain-containing protein [Rosistilla carotiformis]QDV70483.1 FecR protein [Rosistilla carotiformis]
MNSSPDPFDNDEIRHLISALFDGTIDDAAFERLDHAIATNPETRRMYLEYLQIHQELPDLLGPTDAPQMIRGASVLNDTADDFVFSPQASVVGGWMTAVIAAALLIPISLVVGIYVGRSSSKPDASTAAANPIAVASEARFVSLAHARFFGELPPQIGASPTLNRDYLLIQGMVELGFPSGATAVIQGPASFRVEGNELLALDIGQCSVHAPAGAEGFKVETPRLSIVDRGTRFSVNVSQASETDVQVVEGAADVYEKSDSKRAPSLALSSPLRLEEKQAMRFASSEFEDSAAVPFDRKRYQYGLPDRVVSYQATTSDTERARALTSVTVQRGQQIETIPVDQLIPSRLTWFHALPNHGYLAGEPVLPGERASFASDRFLHTGVINIGGNKEPLTSDPIMTIDPQEDDFGTPGMAIQFDRPVRNGPGPDVVLFELQLLMNPLEGDAFHVSPLKFEQGLHSHTISSFDLTMESPESLVLDKIHLFKFKQVPRSLEQLETFPCTSLFQGFKTQAIAVGIDLSDLGYPLGATVEGLFFQDDLADEYYLDPVFIAGLPEKIPSQATANSGHADSVSAVDVGDFVGTKSSPSESRPVADAIDENAP